MIEVKNEIYRDVPKRFMKEFDRYEPVIKDHTAMITAKTCLRMFFYRIVLGFTSKESSHIFAWGNSYHKFREVLEKNYGYGDAAPPTFNESKAQEAFTVAATEAVGYWKKYGKDQEIGSKFEFMTTERMLRTCVEAYKHWSQEKKQGAIKVIAVEQPFNIQLSDGTYRGGRADQIVRWMGKLWGRDFKTTSKDSYFFERQLDPNEQFTGYTFAEQALCGGEQVQGQLVEVMYNGKGTKKEPSKGGPTIYTFTASRTPYQLKEWEQDHIFYTQILKRAREEDRYPMQEVACSFCPYHSVCKQPNESAMAYQLKTQYVLEPWDYNRHSEAA